MSFLTPDQPARRVARFRTTFPLLPFATASDPIPEGKKRLELALKLQFGLKYWKRLMRWQF